jgi:outer membrane protein
MRKIFLASLALVAAAAPAHADPIQPGDVLVRLRGIMVAPNEKSSGIVPAFPAERVKVGDDIMPEVDITYMATPNIGLELIAATTKHRIAGTTGTTGSIGRLGSAWALPPTLTLQYHPVADGRVRPYVGAGLNYTMFYSEKASTRLEAAVGTTGVRLGDSVGWAAQAGVDIDLSPRLFLNLDV